MLYGVNPIYTRTYEQYSSTKDMSISVKTIEKHQGIDNNSKTNLKYKGTGSTNKKSFKEVLQKKVEEIQK